MASSHMISFFVFFFLSRLWRCTSFRYLSVFDPIYECVYGAGSTENIFVEIFIYFFIFLNSTSLSRISLNKEDITRYPVRFIGPYRQIFFFFLLIFEPGQLMSPLPTSCYAKLSISWLQRHIKQTDMILASIFNEHIY